MRRPRRPLAPFPGSVLSSLLLLGSMGGCCSDNDNDASGTPQLAEGADLAGSWRITTTIASASSPCTGVLVGNQEIDEVPFAFDRGTRLVTIDPGTPDERVALLTGLTIRLIENDETERRDTTITFNNAGSTLAGTSTSTFAATGCAVERRIEGTKILAGASLLSTWLDRVRVGEVVGEHRPGAPPLAGSDPTGAVTGADGDDGAVSGVLVVRTAGGTLFDSLVVAVAGVPGHLHFALPNQVAEARVWLDAPVPRPAAAFPTGSRRLQVQAGLRGAFGPPVELHLADSGAQQGLRVALTWDTSADLDLHLVEPLGFRVWAGAPLAPSGGRLDRDANAACRADGSAETITYRGIHQGPTLPPHGSYAVEVGAPDGCFAAPTTFAVRVDGVGPVPILEVHRAVVGPTPVEIVRVVR
jgi:hypothetical protein